jgi:hypothetical protein
LRHSAIDEHDGYTFATGGDGLAAAFTPSVHPSSALDSDRREAHAGYIKQ